MRGWPRKETPGSTIRSSQERELSPKVVLLVETVNGDDKSGDEMPSRSSFSTPGGAGDRNAIDPGGRFRSVGRVRLEERRRFIRPPVLQSLLLATQRVVEVTPDDRGGQAGFPTELSNQFVEHPGNQFSAMGIVLVSPSCGPECARVFDRQVGSLVRQKRAQIRAVRVVLVTFPTLEQRTNDSDGAGTIDLKIPVEGAGGTRFPCRP